MVTECLTNQTAFGLCSDTGTQTVGTRVRITNSELMEDGRYLITCEVQHSLYTTSRIECVVAVVAVCISGWFALQGIDRFSLAHSFVRPGCFGLQAAEVV